jgi:hypothetical protein
MREIGTSVLSKCRFGLARTLVVLVLSACCVTPALAQVIVIYESIVFSVRSDRDELREMMRREHRARVERATANRPNGVQERIEQSESVQRKEEVIREQREAEVAERRARWQRMSPDERQQLRRDIDQAGRNFYQPPPRREGQ